METIFDHNVTDRELELLLGADIKITREILEDWGRDANLAVIYGLYKLRKEEPNARKYYDMLPNTINKFFQLGYQDH